MLVRTICVNPGRLVTGDAGVPSRWQCMFHLAQLFDDSILTPGSYAVSLLSFKVLFHRHNDSRLQCHQTKQMKLVKTHIFWRLWETQLTLAGATFRFSEPSLGVLGDVAVECGRAPVSAEGHAHAWCAQVHGGSVCSGVQSQPLLLSLLVPHQYTFFFS